MHALSTRTEGKPLCKEASQYTLLIGIVVMHLDRSFVFIYEGIRPDYST